MEKRIIFFLVLILLSSFSTSLGITPAKVEIGFVPGAEHEISYTIISDQVERKMKIYTEGDLFEYTKLSKSESVGPSSFTVRIKFPNEIEKPGMHTILVGAKEMLAEDVFIGTAIDIRSIIKVFVPYPGKYVESEINVPDGNVNDEIPVQVHAINRGKEDLNVDVKVNFFDGKGDLVSTMPFALVQLNATQEKYFRKFLDTTGYRPDNYLAQAVINYGEINVVNKSFRIGSLFVNITNFTNELPKEGIQRFLVNVESRWNGNLDEVYADVDLIKGDEKVNLRTPSIQLGAWSSGALIGFIDTTDLKGKYDVNVTLNYAGQKSFASGTLTITEFNITMIIALVVIAAIVIITAGVVIVLMIRRRKSKGKK